MDVWNRPSSILWNKGGLVCMCYMCKLCNRCSVKRMKNEQEYCSVLKVQFTMNQKQLSWLLFHMLLSARKCFSFFNFLQVKLEQNGIKWGIFFPTKCKSVGRLGQTCWKQKKADFGDSRGGLPYICLSPKPPVDLLLNWIMTACKKLSLLLSYLPPTGLQSSPKWFY